jgi:hypothetical protein
MCPTELMYEKGSAPCIRLLPIDTRASGTGVAELRGFAEEWTTIPLDIESPDKVAHALQHIAEIKKVTKETAQTLGLHIAEEETRTAPSETAWSKCRGGGTPLSFRTSCSVGLVIHQAECLGAEPGDASLPSAHVCSFAADPASQVHIQVWHDFISNPKHGTKGPHCGSPIGGL